MSNQNKNNPSIFFAGHFAIDNIIRFKRINKASLGGSVCYSSLALRKYTQDANISIISHIGTINFNGSLLKQIKNKNIDLRGIKYSNVKNTNFVLDYFDHARILTLKSRSPNLKFKDIPPEYLKTPPDIVVLVPLCNEISLEYVSQISRKFPDVYIGIDIQGFIRNIDENGKVSYVYNDQTISNINKIIDLIGDNLILKGSEEEMKLFADEYENSYKVMNYFEKYDNDGLFIMTLGEKGSMIYKKGNPILKIPAFKPKRVNDETGAGDVYFSIFLYEFIQSNKSWDLINSCAFLASAAASFLVEKKGPSGFVPKLKVIKRVKRKKYID
ncbi:MAG: PfkB family carbohydrate kinase [Candidatus Hermodarchaeota archaeon]